MTDYFAIDTNILVYAYDELSPFHQPAMDFLQHAMNHEISGKPSICITYQTCIEFIHSTTWQKLANPLTIPQAIDIIENLMDFGVKIVYPKPSQLATFLNLLKQSPSRKKLFDIAIVATLKDHQIKGIYTANVKDFQQFSFLTVINPLSH